MNIIVIADGDHGFAGYSDRNFGPVGIQAKPDAGVIPARCPTTRTVDNGCIAGPDKGRSFFMPVEPAIKQTFKCQTMETAHFCQSCSMPIDDLSLRGTELDGSLSQDYCKYCYAHGMFIHPTMTLEGMRHRVIEKMEEQQIPNDIIEVAVQRLPDLKRWQPAITS